MEDLLATQQKILEAIQQLYANFKKDGSERKTQSYIKKRLETLESYAQEYHRNYIRLQELCDETHPYIAQKKYEEVMEFFSQVKRHMQSYQLPEEKSRPTTPVLKTPVFNPGPSNTAPQPVPVKESGTNSRMDELMKKQASNFKALKRTINSIDLDTLTEKWELEDFLRSLQMRWSAIDTLHWELDSELEGSHETYELEFNAIERLYNSNKKAVSTKIYSVTHREYSTPKMDIPLFHGSYHQWIPFKDLYTETIHSNASLSNAQKMQFLKSKLKGEPERLIQHLQISSNNYEISWEILNHRYNNPKLIFTSHISNLMNLPVCQQATVSNIKRIHDTAKESLNAIKNLGVDVDTWDPLVVHILSQKLDSETLHDYVQSLNAPRELPKLEDFFSFLEATFTSMESSRKKQDPNSTPQKPNNFQSASKNFSKKTTSPNNLKQSYAGNSGSPNNSKQTAPGSKQKSNPTKNIHCPLCNRFHGLYRCKEFLNMAPYVKFRTVEKLNVCKNCLFSHNGNTCTSEHRCRICNGKHNTILHESNISDCDEPPPPPPATSRNPQLLRQKSTFDTSSASDDEQHYMNTRNAHVTQQCNNSSEILLATAVIRVEAADGSPMILRALIDQGSQISLISENAAQRLGIRRQGCKGSIFGIGVRANSCKGVINITCSSLNNDYTFDVSTFIMQNLIKHLPNQTFKKPRHAFLNNIELADPDYNISRPVDILLGADVYPKIILAGICKNEDQNLPVAQQTRLGWILCGNTTTTYQCNVVLNNIDGLEKFWEAEDISEDYNISVEDKHCLDYYQQTTIRHPDGKYEVRLPMEPNLESKLGQTKKKAAAQLQQLERKFSRKEQIAKQYKQFIHEYLELEHMKPADINVPDTERCYIPHLCVERADSTTTALRVVFNASNKTSTGVSLNDLMYTGPNLQQDLQSLVVKWRQYKVAFTADIEKMFRQIWVNIEDQKLQTILWRDWPNMPMQQYQLTTVTYGTKAAPYLAMMTLKQLANDERSHYKNSNAIKALEESFYMDDLLFGADSIEAAINIKEELISLLRAGGFNLRKWNSNKTQLLDDVTTEQQQHPYIENNFEFKQANSTKTLGLRWNPAKDIFTFKYNMGEPLKRVTKRTLLSQISKLYDPLGWLAPVTLKLKILFQQVWETDCQWDDELPDSIKQEWIKTSANLQQIDEIKVPRWLGTQGLCHVELHGFCDASEKAFGCVIFAKVTHNNKTEITLVTAKTRLVPRKKATTIPRLELCGAVLLAKLMDKIVNCLKEYNPEVYGWCDSTAVLGWINGKPEKYKPFVANRTKQITKIIRATNWLYVKSEDNPADCASRGMSPAQLKDHTLWWHGPVWLEQYQKSTKTEIYTTNEEANTVCAVTTKSQQEDSDIICTLLNDQSSFTRAVRIMAWILRCKTNKTVPRQPYLSLSELKSARNKIIKHIQQHEFENDITQINKSNQVHPKSKIAKLHPFIDKDGILRVDGRLENARISGNMKHPIILPNKNRLTDLIIQFAHNITFHGGARLTSAFIRQNYWIIGGNRATKRYVRNCVTCRRNSPRMQPQLMGDLPTARCNPSRAFHHVGVDYTGYFDVKANKGRGIKTTKGYVAVFVCMATKAVHLELVSDMSSSAFLAALRRMAARRGTPRHIYCDNGTNFVGASRVLEKEMDRLQQQQDYNEQITDMGITFHFNAPSWPSAGGLWEAAVKSLKHHIRRVIGKQKLTYEEYATLLAQLETCLNSRPLCALTEDVDDLNFLTPAHFLTTTMSGTFIETEHDARTRWQLITKLLSDMWKKWKTEYLTQLNVRNKWQRSHANIDLDTMVTVQDDNQPPGKWLMGRVIGLHPGKDGHVRVVTLKTKNGVIKRPVSKLSVLPLQQENQQEIKKPETRSTKTNFATLAMALSVIFLTIITPACAADSVTMLPNNQTLYFDPISNIQLIRDEWRLVVYYNMQSYWDGVQVLDKYLQQMSDLCIKAKREAHCDMILLQLRHNFRELEYYNAMLLGKHTEHTRHRRGLINAVGNIANSLFGVLDNHFAEQYEKDITQVRVNHKHLSQLVAKQISVLEAENNVISRIEDSINQQNIYINGRLQQIEHDVTDMQLEIQRYEYVMEFTSFSIIANNLLMNLKGIQTMLLDALSDIYHGKFNYHLLSPKQLQNELNIVAGYLNKELILPISNLQAELDKMYQFLRVKARMTEKYLIFEIKVPLITRDIYNVYQIIPIPLIQNRAVNIIPIASYIAINIVKDLYIPLTENDILHCLHYDTSTDLCRVKKPIYSRTSDEDFCMKINQTNTCETSKDRCRNKWVELNKINTYLFICCNTCSVRLICEDRITMKQLTSAGVVELQPGCLIKTDELTLFSHREHNSNVSIKPELYSPAIASINHAIHISIPNTTTQPGYLTGHVNQRLENISKLIDDLRDREVDEDVSFHNIHHYSVIYLLVIAVTVAGAVYGVRRCRTRRLAFACSGPPPADGAADAPQRSLPCARARVSTSTSPVCMRSVAFSNSDN